MRRRHLSTILKRETSERDVTSTISSKSMKSRSTTTPRRSVSFNLREEEERSARKKTWHMEQEESLLCHDSAAYSCSEENVILPSPVLADANPLLACMPEYTMDSEVGASSSSVNGEGLVDVMSPHLFRCHEDVRDPAYTEKAQSPKNQPREQEARDPPPKEQGFEVCTAVNDKGKKCTYILMTEKSKRDAKKRLKSITASQRHSGKVSPPFLDNATTKTSRDNKEATIVNIKKSTKGRKNHAEKSITTRRPKNKSPPPGVPRVYIKPQHRSTSAKRASSTPPPIHRSSRSARRGHLPAEQQRMVKTSRNEPQEKQSGFGLFGRKKRIVKQSEEVSGNRTELDKCSETSTKDLSGTKQEVKLEVPSTISDRHGTSVANSVRTTRNSERRRIIKKHSCDISDSSIVDDGDSDESSFDSDSESESSAGEMDVLQFAWMCLSEDL